VAFSEHSPYPSGSGIVLFRPDRAALGFGVGLHAAEFPDAEPAALAAYPPLAVEDRTGAVPFHQERNQKEQRCGQRQQYSRSQKVHQALEVAIPNPDQWKPSVIYEMGSTCSRSQSEFRANSRRKNCFLP